MTRTSVVSTNSEVFARRREMDREIRGELATDKEQRKAQRSFDREYASALFRRHGWRAIEIVVEIMENTLFHEKVRLDAAKVLLDRAFGTPRQDLQVQVETTQVAPAPLLNDPAMRAALIGIHELLEDKRERTAEAVVDGSLADPVEENELEVALMHLPEVNLVHLPERATST